MALILSALAHRYDSQTVLDDFSLTVEPGEVVALLGASGSGKSTVLRLVAGLLPLQNGAIRWADTVLATPGQEIPPERRSVGLMFQDHVLFPHLTAADNLAFGLGHLPKADRREQVRGWLERVGLAGLAERYPHTLSGGQQQRLALARALATEPQVMLLDEPFANVDSARRRALREDARLTLKAAGAATIVVTHDPDEALELADRVAVLEAGRIVQCGEPESVWSTPATLAVAELFGDSQRVPVRRQGAQLQSAFGAVTGVAGAAGAADGDRALMLVRDEALSLVPGAGAQIIDHRFASGRTVAVVEAENCRLRVPIAGPSAFPLGGRANVIIDPRGARLYPEPAR
ncbi:MAG: ABC transporter ATP-binding protein [Pseudomonadota bacterium]